MAFESPQIYSRKCLIEFDSDTPTRPYLTFKIGPEDLHRLVSNPANPFSGSSTFFTFGLIQSPDEVNQGSDQDFVEFQRNLCASSSIQCHTNEWILGLPVEEEENEDETPCQYWLESLAHAEDVEIGLFPVAQSKSWVNTVWKMEVEVYGNGRNESSRLDGLVDFLMDSHDKVAYRQRSKYHQRMTKLCSDADLTLLAQDALDCVQHLPPPEKKHETSSSDWRTVQFQAADSIQPLGLVSKIINHVIGTAGSANALPHQQTMCSTWVQRATWIENSRIHIQPNVWADEKGHARATGTLQSLVQKGLDGQHSEMILERNGILDSLLNLCRRRSTMADNTEALTQIIDVLDAAVNVSSKSHGNRAHWLSALARLLFNRDQKTYPNSGDDLNRSVQIMDEVIDITPPTDPQCPAYLSFLVDIRTRIFYKRGSLKDLHRTVEAAETAVRLTDHDHSRYADRLDNLGSALCMRFGQLGSPDDLHRAIQTLELGLVAAPQDSPVTESLRGNLGVCYLRLHESKGSLDDLIDELNYAIYVCEKAMELRGALKDDPDYASFLALYSTLLAHRSAISGSAEDSEKATMMLQNAAFTMPDANPNRILLMCNLGRRFLLRFYRSKSEVDLDKAARILHGAEKLLLEDHPCQAMLCNDLAECYLMRGWDSSLPYNVLRYALQGWNSRSSPPSDRIFSARVAARALSVMTKLEEASELLDDAIKLLPSLSPRGLKTSDQQYKLKPVAELSHEAATAAIRAKRSPMDILRLLESSRGVMASLLLETRTEISELRESHPVLVDQFESLRDEIDSHSEQKLFKGSRRDIHLIEEEITRRLQADQQFRAIIDEIRAVDGFENFLLPPNTQELLSAASSGPIVVLTSGRGICHAITITTQNIRLFAVGKHVRLIDDTGVLKLSTRLLEGLWDGYHYENSPDTVLDRVVSSYSTSIKSLLQARQNSARKTSCRVVNEACLVSMSTTPPSFDMSPVDLDCAEEEIGRLESLLYPDTPTTILNQPKKSEVLKQLETSTTFHFAGHGISNPTDPSKSCLLLEDWVENPLTVEDLTALKLFAKVTSLEKKKMEMEAMWLKWKTEMDRLTREMQKLQEQQKLSSASEKAYLDSRILQLQAQRTSSTSFFWASLTSMTQLGEFMLKSLE
ncbi:TPR domain-containing protein [Colletotrichum kahawae]|uniref:TPR domain-containing protein n=1 Tax=Colletotrichum kahawae TaxID=34407 RepID=A0AAE0D8L3_COLKA|nr:TPR domain-containing protein [Colletotrichum kahawae]